MKKNVIRFFTIADFIEEENWLRDMNRKGWKLKSMTLPCFFHFESCEPEDVVYRLDFRDAESAEDYLQMLSDYGWEHFEDCVGWMYLRKPVSGTEEEGELFSDNESKLDMVEKIIKTRILPLAVLFLCSVLPNFFRTLSGEYIGPFGKAAGVFFCVLFVIYVFLLIHCGTKLRRLRDRYTNK